MSRRVPPSCFVGVDVGGTFTDVVLAHTSGRVWSAKVVTTPEDPRQAVVEGVAQVLDAAGLDGAAVTRVVHATTLATNVILERRGRPVAFVTTEGFADLLRLGREARVEDDRFDLFFRTPRPPVDHRLTFEIHERVDATGHELIPLTPAEAARVASRVAAAGPEAVAICLLHAYAAPDHERAVAAACRAALPDAYVVASSEVWPEMREYERAMTTVMCGYVGPVMAGYLAGLQQQLAKLGVGCPVQIMDSSGGVMSSVLACRRPVYTVESGGAAGVIVGGFVGRLLGADQVISFDMGGTTAKAGIVRHGRPDITHDFQVGGKGSFGGTRPGTGFPIKIPVVDLAEVGAGGGSIAWVDSGGALRVGPRSAGSVPGPACYGRGGRDPTVTDANLVLGYLRPGGLAGGVVASRHLAEAALDRAVAGPMGLKVAAAARGVYDIVNANMAAAIRVVTIQRGVDPRGFTLVGFGGAGPMHVARLAETFGIAEIAVPWAAGVASAIGLVASDLSVDQVLTRIMDEAELDPSLLNRLFEELEDRGRAELTGTGDGPITVGRAVDARYRGQAHQLTVAVPDGVLGEADLVTVGTTFHDQYRQSYGIDVRGPIQLVNFRVRVVRTVPKLTLVPAELTGGDPTAALAGHRDMYFPESGGHAMAAVYDWNRLAPGSQLSGPASVESPDTTVLVPPGYEAGVDAWRTLRLRRVTISSKEAAT